MTPLKLQLKLFLSAETTVNFHTIGNLFHRWIQQGSVDGLLIDVADYQHVPDGPGVLLIGHAVDYAVDWSDGRFGLLVTRKVARVAESRDFAAHLAWLLNATRKAANLLEAEADLGLTFEHSHFELRLPDRLNAPNTAEAFANFEPTVASVFANACGASPEVVWAENDRRKPLTLQVLTKTTKVVTTNGL